MGREKGKSDSRPIIGRLGGVNERGTYGIVGEDGEVIRYRNIKQLFRGKSAADNMCLELNKKSWENLEVVKLR